MQRARTLLLLAALCAPSASAQDLVARYALDELAGAVCQESSGDSNDGLYTGGAALAAPGAATGTGTAVRFDGLDGHVAIPAGPALDALNSGFSVSAWLQVNDTSAGWRRVFGNQGAWGCGIWQNQLTFTANGVADYFSGGVIQQGEWLHVVWVYDDSFNVSFYVDGALYANATGPGPPGAPTATWFIASHEGTSHMFPGALDDVQVYDAVLSDAEVAQLFALPGSTLEAVGSAYCFGDGSGTFCPCGNPGGASEGCANSTGAGASLSAGGGASASQDVLFFDAEGLVPGQTALLFAGVNATNGGAGLLFGDGLRCAGGSVVRLGVRTPDAAGSASWGPGLVAPLGVVGGDLRRFQAWYRDPSGSSCGFGFNLSHGVEVGFIP